MITFSPAWVSVVSPFDEELELFFLCHNAVFKYFLNSIYWTVGRFVQLSRLRGERGGVVRAWGLCDSVRVYDLRFALAVDSEGAIAPLLHPVRALGGGWQLAFLLTTVGRVNKDVVSRTDVHICAAHSFVEVLLVARLRFLQAFIGACDCLVESNEEFMPVPAVRFRAISQTAVQKESGWRSNQYEVEGRRPCGPMDMAVVGVRQRGRGLVPGVLMFFYEAHKHVL